MPRVRAGLTVRLTTALVVAAAVVAAVDAATARGGDGGGDDAKKPAPAKPAPDAAVPGADAAAVAKMTPEERAKRLDVALTALSKALSGVKAVRASFVQTKRLEVFDRDVVSRGTIALKKPDLFRWETTEPIRSELVVSGTAGVRRRTSRKGEVTETEFELAKDPVTAATVQQVFLWTTGDFAKAAASYTLELVSEAPLIVLAKPSDERIAKVVLSVEVEFASGPTRLVRVKLTEQTGSHSTIAFQDVEHDPELPADLFSIEPKSSAGHDK